MTAIWVAVLAAAGTAALLPRPRSALAAPTRSPSPSASAEGMLRRHRALCAALAAIGAVSFLDGMAQWVGAAGAAVGVWLAASRLESPAERARRAAVHRDLPHVVLLLSLALAAGASVAEALRQVYGALPGPATEPLRTVAARLDLGVPAADVWSGLDDGLAPLGRTLVRAATSGSSVADAVARLAGELAAEARAEIEDRARAVGIAAAVPLGLCLLPAFLLVGIVPVVIATVQGLTW